MKNFNFDPPGGGGGGRAEVGEVRSAITLKPYFDFRFDFGALKIIDLDTFKSKTMSLLGCQRRRFWRGKSAITAEWIPNL